MWRMGRNRGRSYESALFWHKRPVGSSPRLNKGKIGFNWVNGAGKGEIVFSWVNGEGNSNNGFTGQELRASKIWMMNVGIDTDGTDQVLCGKFLRGDYYDSDGSNCA